MIRYTFIVFLAVLMTACNDELPKSLGTQNGALGKKNEIVIVSDADLWEGTTGDTIQYYYESAYPLLPTPEPFFDLRHFTPTQIKADKYRRELRTYLIIADLSDEESSTTQIVKQDLGEEKFNEALADPTKLNSIGLNKWARGQLVIYIYSNGKENLNSAISRTFPAVAKRVLKHDADQLEANVYGRVPNKGLAEQIANEIGIKLKIPGEYQVAMQEEEESIYWLRKDEPDFTLNLVVQKIPYSNKSEFSFNKMKELRDIFGKKYVSSDEKDTYMVTNDVDLPTMKYQIEIDSSYALETRGIWEMENDFKGGPYASYMTADKSGKNLIFIDVFVFAPGQKKRDLMQQLEYIVQQSSLQ